MLIKPIPAAATHALRHSVLRPHQTLAEMAFEGDDDERTMHFGAMERPTEAAGEVGGEVVGVASVYCKAPSSLYLGAHVMLAGPQAWQLRGMATHPRVRGMGAGGMVLERCIAAVAERGGEVFWCNARVGVRGFYERFGLTVFGEEFTPPGIGPHVFMYRVL